MAHAHDTPTQIVENFRLPGRMRNTLLGLMGVGFLFILLSFFITPNFTPFSLGDEHGHATHESHGGGHDDHDGQGGAAHDDHDDNHGDEHDDEHDDDHDGAAHDEHEGEAHGNDAHETTDGTEATDGTDEHSAAAAPSTPARFVAGEPTAEAHNDAAHGHGSEDAGTVRLWANLLTVGYLFTGTGVLALFFIAVNYVTNAGWMIVVKRIAEAMTLFIPIGGLIIAIVVLAGGHHLYHWMHDGIMVEGSSHYDPLLASKQWWLNPTGLYARLFIVLVIWTVLALAFRRASLREDELGATRQSLGRMVGLGALTLIAFTFSWMVGAWDWLMAIDPHWFSTMYWVYTFASCFVSALCIITIVAIYLCREGYLPMFNPSHMHDLGKYVFAFSIFWTYIWFCQFMLIWYANIPEETQYFADRVGIMNEWNGPYVVTFVLTFLINFIVPFLGLMTAGSKRNPSWLMAFCFILLFGHFMDFYMMIHPGAMKNIGMVGTGPFGIQELGFFLFFLGGFLLFVFNRLGKAALVPKNHPFLKESALHHFPM